MSDNATTIASPSSSSASAYLLVPILLLFALLVIAVLRSPNLISSAGIGSAVIVTTPLVLATYALMAIAIAGRGTVDLSIGPLIGFINVTLVALNDAGVVQAPLEVFAYAIAVGVAYQLVMGLIIVFVRVQPIIVSLSGYLALSGINLVVLARPGGTAPEWMMSWGLGTAIMSPVLIILVLCTGAWLLFARTAFFSHLRLMGSDERAAYTAGVRIALVRLGAHCIAGLFAALAALTFTSLIGSGDPTQGTTYTLVAVTALVLGGTSLAGGRGGAIGSLLGAVNLFLIGYVLATFSFGMVQGFVTDLAYGVILVLSLLLTVALPHLQKTIRNVSPFLVFVVLSLLFTGVMLHAKYDYTPRTLAEATKSVTVVTPTATSSAAAPPDASSPLPAADSARPPLPNEASSAAVPADVASAPVAAVAASAPVETASTAPTAPSELSVPASSTTRAIPTHRPAESFVFERFDEAPALPGSPMLRAAGLSALLLVVLVALARVVVAETDTRGISPMLYASFVVVILLGCWVLIDMMEPTASPPEATAPAVR